MSGTRCGPKLKETHSSWLGALGVPTDLFQWADLFPVLHPGDFGVSSQPTLDIWG